MNKNIHQIINELRELGLNPEQEARVIKELEGPQEHKVSPEPSVHPPSEDLYSWNDLKLLLQMDPRPNYHVLLQSIDRLMEKDRQREKDGFPRKIRLGKLMKPSKDNKGQVIVVPTTTEAKFYHHDDPKNEEQQTGGAGDGDVGEVIGEQSAKPGQGEGGGQGAGQGGSAQHDIGAEAFDLGRILTEQFSLPNLKDKGKKKSLTKYKYDLTDMYQGFGQILDKKSTMKKIIETNIHLGRVKPDEPFESQNLLINPEDKVYRILSKEPDYEAQAVVFFLRDYSGSMHGKPTEVVTSQHLFIYSWLMYQYQNNVQSRFILHDTEAKEVDDFYEYYKSTVAGGTNVFPAYELVDKIVEEEQLEKDYNIYVFHGTDGDDWDSTGEKMLTAARKILRFSNRLGITIAKNNWGSYSEHTTVERYINNSGILDDAPALIRMDTLIAEKTSETRLIEGIRRLIEE